LSKSSGKDLLANQANSSESLQLGLKFI